MSRSRGLRGKLPGFFFVSVMVGLRTVQYSSIPALQSCILALMKKAPAEDQLRGAGSEARPVFIE